MGAFSCSGGNGIGMTNGNDERHEQSSFKEIFRVKAKSVELYTEDGKFFVVERGKGRSHLICFSVHLLQKVLEFIGLACSTKVSDDLQKTLGFKGGSLFLPRQGNDYGRFIRICEWKPEVRNPFVIVPKGEGKSR